MPVRSSEIVRKKEIKIKRPICEYLKIFSIDIFAEGWQINKKIDFCLHHQRNNWKAQLWQFVVVNTFCAVTFQSKDISCIISTFFDISSWEERFAFTGFAEAQLFLSYTNSLTFGHIDNHEALFYLKLLWLQLNLACELQFCCHW